MILASKFFNRKQIQMKYNKGKRNRKSNIQWTRKPQLRDMIQRLIIIDKNKYECYIIKIMHYI